MEYDIILVVGEIYFDHPLCGAAILKRLLEKKGFSVGIIDQPIKEEDIAALGKPRLFFGVSSGSIDSMVRNYTPLKKFRKDDNNLDYDEDVPDRAVIVFSNWIKKRFKDSTIVLGGTEASLRRFIHYDYWQNRLRRSILFDSRADILSYGSSEKQIVEIADRLKDNKKLEGIKGTCIISKNIPDNFKLLPSSQDISKSKESFCDMQNMLNNHEDLAQEDSGRYILQYKIPEYTSHDLDEYYELPFTREVPKELRGFQFSIVTHRGCIGKCNFCSLNLTQGDKIISRSENSILREAKKIVSHKNFRGNIDDLTAPSVGMYGMDCNLCKQRCIDCKKLDRTNKRFISLLRSLRDIKGIDNVFIRSGLRYDLCSEALLKEIIQYHIFDTLRIAPEHIDKDILKIMGKDYGDLALFIKRFKLNSLDCNFSDKKLSFYFMTAHPGSDIKKARILSKFVKDLENSESVQIFTPTPMTNSTCMYYTGLDLFKRKIHVPYSYNEKKCQKRVIFDNR